MSREAIQEFFPEAVWFYRAQGLNFMEIVEILWPRLKRLRSNKQWKANIRRIRRIQNDQERVKEVMCLFKGYIDNILVRVFDMGLCKEYLQNPKEYGQGTCHTLWREFKAKQNTATPKAPPTPPPPDPRFK